jgi:AraC-like DNA-binding protein
MEPLLEKIPLTSKNSFALKEDILPHITTPWHLHPEYELTLIAEGSGKRFVGDHMEFFESGDMILIGPNLPHFHRNSKIYYEGIQQLRVRAIVIHFMEDFLGKDFFSRPEMIGIKQLLTRSKQGLKIAGKTRTSVAAMMEEMLVLDGVDRILQLIEILHVLSKSSELHMLSSMAFDHAYNSTDMKRINQVYQFMIDNYRNEVSLEEVASQINMSPSAFCRFFKKRTGKTFSSFLNELRIGYACKLLMEKDLTVSQICYESGFNNFSYFSRQFKAITHLSPLKYKKQFSNF